VSSTPSQKESGKHLDRATSNADYNGRSFFVRQAYFLGQNDPYKSLKTSLKAEIDQEAWESLNSDTSVGSAPPSGVTQEVL
jgi:adenine-specific DNA-methyltransferase